METEQTLTPAKEWVAVLGFVAAIGFSALGLVSLFKSMFMLLGVFLLTRMLKPNEILQRLPTQIWLIISAALLLSHALNNTKATELLDLLILDNQQAFTPLPGSVWFTS